MSDYQAIYDAVRSRISNGDIGAAVEAVFREANISHYIECAFTVIGYEFASAASYYSRPSAIYRPTIKMDGKSWCALYGENLQDGVAGFGDTPELAMADFDKNWKEGS